MQHPNSFHQKKTPATPSQPEVADREPEEELRCQSSDLNLSIDARTEELEDLPSFKVFLKKNLPYQATPKDLLASIYDRVDRIKAESL
ncbi:hypothetical protein [Neolewinella antarctica]|uniref:Uncharacterized protein n=1 Tax=Neolewinella antarctica TaxID=442734 RepID=A0ABX0XAG5_9BACT|nr:hypothetical protein [Neolewinella antarctica]NJC26266.1 hypothetical protein [Neolewinella antarctica]